MYKVFLLIVALFISLQCRNQDSQSTETQVGRTLIFKNISQEEGLKMISANEDLVVIDVRTPEEIARGKIVESAWEIDYLSDDFAAKIDTIDKDQTYLLYCRSGNRSGKAMKKMKTMGFKEVYNLKGGYLEYQDRGNK